MFKKILVANRGEIAIRVLRAVSELHLRTVAVFTYEDRYSLHRYKADESYQIGEKGDPLKPYLDIEELIKVAKIAGAEAIHPGYGFLSENVDFVRRCEEEGIIFIGPRAETMMRLGDKVRAKEVARKVEVPLIPDSQLKLTKLAEVASEAERIGFPVMLKAAAGGGGRGMRVVRHEEELAKAFYEAKNEAANAFGDDTIFIEKFIDQPKHIEVQILGDNHGNIVHLFERDCSVQRRFQKVVEAAPSILPQEKREQLFDYALRIAREVGYNNAGTVEFLLDKDQNIYFIEVNPRIQVEHTITEEITGVDIVRSQILIASGYRLSDPEINIPSQESLECHGFAVQCRITTEDPSQGFKPDYGRIIAYRSASGFGIRLDAGSAYAGAEISPFFDSLLVKVSGWGRTMREASSRIHRALREFRVRGVNTNISFLLNVMSHPEFYEGKATVNFIKDHPELLDVRTGLDRGTKTLMYLANIQVNGNPDVKFIDENKSFRKPTIPSFDNSTPYPEGSRDRLKKLGREEFVRQLKQDTRIHFTDTTFRDAHQSLLATRMRTIDMLAVAESFARNHPEIFSMEVWGGATFDVCMRFLHECPWTRLKSFREAIPNILLQMLLRGSNAVGYKAYPDNLIEKFIEKAGETGIDIFRIFDSLNWVEAMKVSIRTVRERTDALAEACICYTGDILDPTKTKYNLQYYIDLAKRLEDEGAHILAIKDMAGLLKPYAAHLLVSELKKVLDIPVHLHTHDTASIQTATYLQAIEAGVDVVDVAISSMSGLTSQPNSNAIMASLKGHHREQNINQDKLNEFANYWEIMREYYYPFESELRAGTAQVYKHEIPGGQYSNLLPQARSLGLEDRFEQVKQNYELVNRMFGDIVKVTPSSKVVGDMALFMTTNDYTEQDIYDKADQIAFPDSVISFFRGDLGQPYGGFPEELQRKVLKGETPYNDRPNAHLAPVDFDREFAEFQKNFGEEWTILDFLSSKLYPKVWEDYREHYETYGEVAKIPTAAFFYPMKPNEEIMIELEPGKRILIRYMYTSVPDDSGMRDVFFAINGQTRTIQVKDEKVGSTVQENRKAESENELGAPLQGRLVKIFVKEGDKVEKGDPLFVIEAMKMESTITAPISGTVKNVVLKEKTMVEQDDLVVEMI